MNYELHYYPDKDVSDQEFLYSTQSKIQLLLSSIFIHRNIYNGEKDFGVPINRINEVVKQIQ